MKKIIISLLSLCLLTFAVSAQDHDDHSGDATEEHHESGDHHAEGDHHEGGCHCHDASEDEFDPGETAFHHIMDVNAFHLYGDIYIPLPCILYAPEHGWSFFLSSKFELHEHGDGHKAIDGYVMHHGEVMRVQDQSFPKGEVAVKCFGSTHEGDKEIFQVIYEGDCYNLDKKSTWDGGMLGGGITSYYDFSITKNVFTMLLALFLLFFMFRRVAKAYTTRKGEAPKGIQSLIEPIFVFMRDEVAIPFLGPKYEKYLPFLMSIFFFILGLNLIGQIPFFPGSGNVTGNLAVTMVLALFAFFVTNLSGNKHYWEHIFWMPGVPAWVKTILTPVEVMGLIINADVASFCQHHSRTHCNYHFCEFDLRIWTSWREYRRIRIGRFHRSSIDPLYDGNRIVGGFYSSLCILYPNCFLYRSSD